MAILKYEITKDSTPIKVPKGATPDHIEMKGKIPVLCMTSPLLTDYVARRVEIRNIQVVNIDGHEYVGSFNLGPMLWHMFLGG